MALIDGMIHDVTLVDKIENKEQPNNPTYVYADTNGDRIAFKSTNEPFVFQSVPNHTSPCYKGDVKVLTAISDAFVENGVKQHEYAGGFNEAITTLTLVY